MHDDDDADTGFRTHEHDVLTVVVIVFLLILVWCFAHAAPADAHIHDRPDLDGWVGQLTNRNQGLCCDSSEGLRIDDVDWKVKDDESGVTCQDVPNEHVAYKGTYCVRLEGVWWLVPDYANIDEPNKFGEAMLWPIEVEDSTEAVKKAKFIGIRCFMPGAGA